MTATSSMKISPRFTADDWLQLNLDLDSDWRQGVEIFRDRIEGRFLRPIRKLLPDTSSGFAVLALDSLLIETLQQFWQGVPRTPSKVNKDGCKQLQSEPYFRAFLRGPLYSAGFSRESSRLFYKTIRSGILHQAEAEGTSRIRRRGKAVTLRSDGKGIDINPVKVHEELEKAFSRYLTILLDPGELERRANFVTKMNYIARKPASAVDVP